MTSFCTSTHLLHLNELSLAFSLVDSDVLVLGLLLDLLPLDGSEESLHGNFRAAHELDPAHDLELILDELVTFVSQAIPLREAALAATEGEQALEAKLDAAKEADRNLGSLVCEVLFLAISYDHVFTII